MSQSASPVRVKSGPPWWIWALLVLTTVSVVGMIVINSVPDDPEQLFEDAQALLEKDDNKGLSDRMARLRRQKGYEGHVKFLEGLQAFKQVRDPRALQLMAEIPDDHKLKSLAMVKIGDSHRRTGRYQDSIQAYEKAIALAPESTADARVSLAGLYFSIGAMALAEKTLDEAIQLDPENRQAIETRGLVRFAELRYKEALADFKAVLSTPGQFAAASPLLLESYSRCLVKVGATELINELADEHLSLIDNLEVKLTVMNAAGQADSVKTEISAGEEPEGAYLSISKPALEAALLTEDVPTAERLLEQLLLRTPRDLELFELAVKVYTRTQNAAKLMVAEENLKQLQDLEAKLLVAMQQVGQDFEQADDRLAVARLYRELGRADSARMWFSVVATIDPTYTEEAQDVLNGISIPRKPLVEFSTDANTTADKKPADEKPADEKPADEKPADEKPADEKAADSEDAKGAVKSGDAETSEQASGKTDSAESKSSEPVKADS